MLMTARIYGFVALVLLLAAGGDLLVVDFASSFRCDGSGSESERLPEDDCFCCCAHIDLTTSEASTPVEFADALEVIAGPLPSSPQPSAIYHPPRI